MSLRSLHFSVHSAFEAVAAMESVDARAARRYAQEAAVYERELVARLSALPSS
jgi:hypothetical protein